MKTKEKIQTAEQPIIYYSVCFFSLLGNSYPKENWKFNLHAKTYGGLVNKIKSVFETEYLKNKSFRVYEELQSNSPIQDHPTEFTFRAAFESGLKIQYHIYIKEIYSGYLTD